MCFHVPTLCPFFGTGFVVGLHFPSLCPNIFDTTRHADEFALDIQPLHDHLKSPKILENTLFSLVTQVPNNILFFFAWLVPDIVWPRMGPDQIHR